MLWVHKRNSFLQVFHFPFPTWWSILSLIFSLFLKAQSFCPALICSYGLLWAPCHGGLWRYHGGRKHIIAFPQWLFANIHSHCLHRPFPSCMSGLGPFVWKVARWVFRLVPESSIDNNRQSAPPTVEIISSRNALSCSLPGHAQLFNWTNSLYYIHFLLWSLTITRTIMHCFTNLRTKLVFLSWFSYSGSLDFRLLEERDSDFCLFFLLHGGKHSIMGIAVWLLMSGDWVITAFQQKRTFQSVRRGHFTGGSWVRR